LQYGHSKKPSSNKGVGDIVEPLHNPSIRRSVKEIKEKASIHTETQTDVTPSDSLLAFSLEPPEEFRDPKSLLVLQDQILDQLDSGKSIDLELKTNLWGPEAINYIPTENPRTYSEIVFQPSETNKDENEYESIFMNCSYKILQRNKHPDLIHAWHRNYQKPISTPTVFVPMRHLVKDHLKWLRSVTFSQDETAVPYKSITEMSEWYPVEEECSDKFQYTRSEQREILSLMRDQWQRELTFNDWIPNGQRFGGNLAIEGFFYYNRPLEIQCAFCLMIIKDVDEVQEVADYHQYFSPECPIIRREQALYGNTNYGDANNVKYQSIVEPLHNPSTRKHPTLHKRIPTIQQTLSLKSSDVLSNGAFSKYPPAVFSDPYSLLELQQRALTNGGEDDFYEKLETSKREEDSNKTTLCSPEAVSIIQTSYQKELIMAIPNKENNGTYASVNTLQTLIAPDELGWEPWFSEIFWVKEQKLDRNLNRLRESVQRKQSEFLWKADDDILYQLTPEGWRVIVPEHLWRYVTGAFHDTPIMGHYGPEKTIQRMRGYVYFYQMSSFVTDYIKTCVICQLYKRSHGRVPYQSTSVPPNIFHTISMDLIGPYPKSADGYSYIMIIQCVLTRYLFVIPLKSKCAEEIAARLVDQVFLKVGPPMRLLADNAGEFHSELLKRLSDTFGYHRNFIQTYRPQQNGANERSHAELFRWLKMYMFESKTTRYWSTFKDLLAYAYNTTPHSTLGGKTPFELIYGRKPPLKPLGWPEHSRPSSGDYLKFLGLRDEELQQLRRDTRKVIEFNMRTSLDRANRRLKVPELLVGDEVLEIEQRILPQVVTPKNDWRPTYKPQSLKITEILSDAHVRIKEETGEERIVHVDRIKRFNRRDGCIGFSHLPPQPIEEDKQEMEEDDNDDSRETTTVKEENPNEVHEALVRVLPANEERLREAALNSRTVVNLGPRVSMPQLHEPPAAEGLTRIAAPSRRRWYNRVFGRSQREPRPTNFGSDFDTGPRVQIYGTRSNTRDHS
jgi:hypothetical protein